MKEKAPSATIRTRAYFLVPCANACNLTILPQEVVHPPPRNDKCAFRRRLFRAPIVESCAQYRVTHERRVSPSILSALQLSHILPVDHREYLFNDMPLKGRIIEESRQETTDRRQVSPSARHILAPGRTPPFQNNCLMSCISKAVGGRQAGQAPSHGHCVYRVRCQISFPLSS